MNAREWYEDALRTSSIWNLGSPLDDDVDAMERATSFLPTDSPTLSRARRWAYFLRMSDQGLAFVQDDLYQARAALQEALLAARVAARMEWGRGRGRLSQQEIADSLGVARNTISEWIK